MATITETLTSDMQSNGIRPFDARRDMGQVADLVEKCFADSLDQDGQRYLHQMREFSRNPGFLHWTPLSAEWAGSPFIGYVWEDTGQVIGNVSLIPYRIRGARRYMIANIAVHPEYRRQGIARSLTKQAIKHGLFKGANEIWLQVRHDNSSAIQLYQELNFHERARRTTWYGQQDYARVEIPPDIQIRVGKSAHWTQQENWLKGNYPDELSWHLPLNLRVLRPGFWGSLNRFLSNQLIRHWVVCKSDRLLAALSWQTASPSSNAFWLAAPEGVDEVPLRALLTHAHRNVPKRGQLTLDFPAHKYQDAIQASGFYAHQTLIWMELKL